MTMWQRVEFLDDETVNETTVEITADATGHVRAPVEVVERFLREAGYEEVEE